MKNPYVLKHMAAVILLAISKGNTTTLTSL